MKRVLFIALVAVCFCQVTTAQNIAKIGVPLQEEMTLRQASDLIRINIILDQYDQMEMRMRTDVFPEKESKRTFVVNELKRFSEETQRGVMDLLSTLSGVSDVQSFWIANLISCYANIEAIEKLSLHPDVLVISFDKEQLKIPEDWEPTPAGPTKEITYNVTKVNADQVWALGYKGENVIVAVLDTGVDYYHYDLRNRMWEHPDYPNHGWDYYNNDNNPWDDHVYGHGTHCAGTVAGDGTAGSQTGIAPKARIMAIKILDSQGSGGSNSTGILCAGIQFAIQHGAHIISLSVGFSGGGYYSDKIYLRNAMGNVLNAGMIASVAAGNEHSGPEYVPIPNQISAPGNCPPPWLHSDQTTTGGTSAVVCVGATDQSDVIASLSNWGSSWGPVTWQTIQGFNDYPYNPGMGLIRPDVCAPGVSIKSCARNNVTGYALNSGTSMATPCVAGVMALMLSKNPTLTPVEISAILENTAVHLPNSSSSKNNTYGSGRINALAAVNAVQNISINGASQISLCDSYTYTCQFSGTPPPWYTLRWRVSSNLAIESGQGTNTVKIQMVVVSQTNKIHVDIMCAGQVVRTITKNISGSGGSFGYTNLSSEDFTISSSTTWSGNRALGVKATVPSGVTLTIIYTVSCTDNASIVVEPGGKLIMDGGKITVTTTCPNKMWKGITVLGNSHLPQTAQNQGTVELKNNAIIEHALCAINAVSGGIIKATNATFQNNLQAIKYESYENHSGGTVTDNVGKFTLCTFIINNSNRFSANNKLFSSHVYATEVRGITFEGCTFDNTSTGIKGIGIYTLDAGFKVINNCSSLQMPNGDCVCPSWYNTPTTFQSQTHGIYSSSTGSPRSIYIDQSKFHALEDAVRLSAQGNYRLTRCAFTSIEVRALRSISSSGYRIEENNFSTPSHPSACGIMMENSGIAENRIYKNSFNGFNKGISVIGTNGVGSNIPSPGNDSRYSGLQFICNDFTNNQYDIHVSSSGTVRPYQGSSLQSAGNYFTGTVQSSFALLSPQTINYYYNSLVMSPGGSYKPYNPTSNVTLYVAPSNPCASTFCLLDTIGNPGTDFRAVIDSLEQYKSMQAQYDKLLAQLGDNPELLQELLILSDAMRELSDHAISRILQDSILYLDALKSWYEVVRTPIAKYWLSEVYASEKKYEQAEAILREIPAKFAFKESELTEHENYMQFYNFKKKMLLSDRNWTQLDEAEIAQLQRIAEATQGRSAGMAKGVLCFFYDICYEDKIEEGGEGESGASPKSAEVESSTSGIQDQRYELSIYPNPTQSEIAVATNNPAVKIVQTEIYDFTNRKVHQQTVNQSYGTLRLNDLAQGVYILKVWLDNGDMVVRKVVKQ